MLDKSCTYDAVGSCDSSAAGSCQNETAACISRRGFLAAALAAAGALAGSALAGCKPRPEDEAPGLIPNPTFDVEFSEPILTDRDRPETEIDRLLQSLDLRQKLAQMFIVRPEQMGEATSAGWQTRDFMQQWPVGGVAYFGSNLVDYGQTVALLRDTMQISLEASGIPPFLCVDEEGGSVSRIGGTPGFGIANVGDMRDVGASGDIGYARQVATRLAGYLSPLGFNVDFAPVCDIADNPSNNTMRRRCFGDKSELVAAMAEAQVAGFLESGLLCSAKHFPGIGGVAGDSHFGAITSEQTLEQLWESELLPFQAAIQAKVPFVMVGHLSLPNVSGDGLPASLSPAVIEGLLRELLGFTGLVITDSLEMSAVNGNYASGSSALMAFQAGCDIALLPDDFEAAFMQLLAAVEQGEISEARIDQSVRRILLAKSGLA